MCEIYICISIRIDSIRIIAFVTDNSEEILKQWILFFSNFFSPVRLSQVVIRTYFSNFSGLVKQRFIFQLGYMCNSS